MSWIVGRNDTICPRLEGGYSVVGRWQQPAGPPLLPTSLVGAEAAFRERFIQVDQTIIDRLSVAMR